MVLPEFQGHGLDKLAVRTVLEMAREEARWGLVHAFPAVRNAPSNGICRSLGFGFVENGRSSSPAWCCKRTTGSSILAPI